ncbi:hypothetical protein LCGC14_0298370 [marine sediment metagenome]|uniref:Terminase large subunit gp17-like C-terminal domain-containing protein n=1 Tax=marine sediment metagenome TaxID=412755 RepID=A0A0F9U8B3_9ZZZZ
MSETLTVTPALKEYEPQAWQFVHDTADWFAQNLKIVDRDNQLIPLVVNQQQIQVLFWVGMQFAAGVPVRIIILKARRMGMSTLITALLFMFATLWPNYPVFACAHDQDGTNTLRSMAQKFQEELPEHLKRETAFDSRQDIVFKPPHRSSYNFHTAGGKKGVGRTKEITGLHASEKAHIDSGDKFNASVMAAVPRQNPRSCIFQESTANGEADPGKFHAAWVGAVQQRKDSSDNVQGYLPLFFSWLDFPDYRQAPLPNYTWGELTEKELWLKGLGADEEQLYFRRCVIAEDYSGDADIFSQEFPATAKEAFLASGRPAIPASVISYHESLARPPARKVHLHWDGKGEVLAVDAPEGAMEYWEVWYEPMGVGEADYIVAGDVAEGKLSDPANDKSKPDRHGGAVLNRRYFRIDAIWSGFRMGADVFGQELRKCAEWYNQAWASPEANAAGQAALVPFKDYARIFQRRPSEPVGVEEKELPSIGWKTTTANRDYMIDMYNAACSVSEEVRRKAGFGDRLQIFSDKVVVQEKAFVWKKSGKREHQAGEFDDLLFALFVALQLHMTCPRTLESQEWKTQRKRLGSQWSGGFAGPEDDDEDDEPVTWDNVTTS